MILCLFVAWGWFPSTVKLTVWLTVMLIVFGIYIMNVLDAGWRTKVTPSQKALADSFMAGYFGAGYWDLARVWLADPQHILLVGEDIIVQQWAQDNLAHVTQLIKDGIVRIEYKLAPSDYLLKWVNFPSVCLETEPCENLDDVWARIPAEKLGVIRQLYELVMEYGRPLKEWDKGVSVEHPNLELTAEECKMMSQGNFIAQCTGGVARLAEVIAQIKRINLSHLMEKAMRYQCDVLLGQEEYMK